MQNSIYNEKIEKIGKSDCCGADFFVNYGNGETNCYLCKKCLQPCNIEIKGMIYNQEDEEFNKIVYVKLSEKEIKERVKYAHSGNIQAKLDIITHNQFVIYEKLNKILERG